MHGGTELTGSVVALLAGLSAVSILSTNIILPAFPEIGQELGVSSRELGLTLSSFFITFALAQLVVGPLADRFGCKRLVLGGLTLFVVGTLVAGLANSLDMLIAGRVIQALGVCAAAVLARTIARDLFEGETLARALSLTMIATATAPGFSPLLGSLLTTAMGWRAIFVMAGIAAVVIAFFYARGLGETLPPERRVTQSVQQVMGAYARLLGDGRFILPAGAVSLLMSGLFASFGAAPAILMSGMGLSSQLAGLYFAATVCVVFAAGMASPWRRWLADCCWSARATPVWSGTRCRWSRFSGANPLGTAITMGPFGKEAGLASALLGFLTMGAAAITTWPVSVLNFAPVTTLGATQVVVCLIGLGLFWAGNQIEKRMLGL
ncbi:MFS transporter [Pseudomonas luteola]|uniref:MFS transporter n=1 Tax=Pseudomonas luteola TaxID=47886 RepID=UPI00388EF201